MQRYENEYLEDDELLHLHNEQQEDQHQRQDRGQHPQQQLEQQSQQHAPTQTVVDEAELLAAQAAAEAAAAQQSEQPGGAFNNVGQGLTGKYREMMMEYWQETINSIEHDEHDFKNHQLPLARIKKVMKTDEDVRMISAEAPILFAKGCDVFITELTMRAWIHAEENKRRTLQKSDIAAALTKSDMFDFLIDVVPREEEKPKKAYAHAKPDNIIHSNLHQPPKINGPPKVEDINNHIKPEENSTTNAHSHQDLLQQQLLQQQLMQQQLMQQQHHQQNTPLHLIQNQSHQQVDHSHPLSQPPTNGNPNDANFANFQNFQPSNYNGEF